MRQMALQGAVRGPAFTTTTQGDEATSQPLDLVERRFQAERPNQLWVADLTYVATWVGFVYVTFVVDVFSRSIVGWRLEISPQRPGPRRAGAGGVVPMPSRGPRPPHRQGQSIPLDRPG